MAKKAADIEKDTRLLPRRERARLVRNLIASLDTGEEMDAERAWLDEAERRLADYEAGVREARPADDVFADLQGQLK